MLDYINIKTTIFLFMFCLSTSYSDDFSFNVDKQQFRANQEMDSFSYLNEEGINQRPEKPDIEGTLTSYKIAKGFDVGVNLFGPVAQYSF